MRPMRIGKKNQERELKKKRALWPWNQVRLDSHLYCLLIWILHIDYFSDLRESCESASQEFSYTCSLLFSWPASKLEVILPHLNMMALWTSGWRAWHVNILLHADFITGRLNYDVSAYYCLHGNSSRVMKMPFGEHSQWSICSVCIEITEHNMLHMYHHDKISVMSSWQHLLDLELEACCSAWNVEVGG